MVSPRTTSKLPAESSRPSTGTARAQRRRTLKSHTGSPVPTPVVSQLAVKPLPVPSSACTVYRPFASNLKAPLNVCLCCHWFAVVAPALVST